MKITRRIESGARKVARATRAAGSGTGPEAVYARVLDGEHLWVALEAGAGRPALLVTDTDRLVEAPGEPDPAAPYAAARWALADLLPLTDGAEASVVALPPGGGSPQSVRPAPPAPESNMRVPATGDGRWRYALVADDGVLRVRRTLAVRLARLGTIRALGQEVELTCQLPDADVAPALHFVTKDGAVARSVDATLVGTDLVVRLSARDLPEEPAGYRLGVGAVEDPISIVRRTNDVHILDGSHVPMPFLLDPETETVAGRFAFSPQGVLRMARKDPTEELA